MAAEWRRTNHRVDPKPRLAAQCLDKLLNPALWESCTEVHREHPAGSRPSERRVLQVVVEDYLRAAAVCHHSLSVLPPRIFWRLSLYLVINIWLVMFE